MSWKPDSAVKPETRNVTIEKALSPGTIRSPHSSTWFFPGLGERTIVLCVCATWFVAL